MCEFIQPASITCSRMLLIVTQSIVLPLHFSLATFRVLTVGLVHLQLRPEVFSDTDFIICFCFIIFGLMDKNLGVIEV